jgi:CDP-glucose 4,6-dehydratase
MVVKIEFWKNRNVFVTGALGLVGSSLVPELLKREANVTILERDHTSKSGLVGSKIIEEVNSIKGELEDFELILRILNEYEIDTVFHLGAQTIVPTANRNPLSTFNSNIKGTWNLLEACRLLGSVKRIVVASTDKVYGTQKKLPYTEEMELNGIYPYDVSKVCADLISQSYIKAYNMPIAITRCGNIYGPGDINFSRIVPGALQAALLGKTLEIRSDGNFIRDYIFMQDVVLGNIKIAEQLESDKVRGEIFNLSTNNRLSVLDTIKKIVKTINRPIKTSILNSAKNEIKAQYLSSEKAETVLGWKAMYSFEDGIKETLPWYIDYFEK